MWDSKPKNITSAILGLEAKIAPTFGLEQCSINESWKQCSINESWKKIEEAL